MGLIFNVFCPVCLIPGTMVYTGPFFEDIENIPSGKRIAPFDSENYVMRTITREYDGDVVTVKARYLPPFTVTPEHPLKISEITIKRVKCKRVPSFNETWKPAGNLKTCGEEIYRYDCLVVPKKYRDAGVKSIVETRSLIKHPGYVSANIIDPGLDETWASLFGWYMAEGSTTGKGVQFALHSEETEYREEIKELAAKLGYKSVWKKNPNENGGQLEISSRVLPIILSHYLGKGAENKRVPSIIINGDDKVVSAFLRAYEKGDGSTFYTKRQSDNPEKILSLKSTSEQLIRQLQLMYFSQGIVLGYGSQKGPPTFQKRTVNSLQQYNLKGKINRNHNWSFF